jgi:hypothetical protein
VKEGSTLAMKGTKVIEREKNNREGGNYKLHVQFSAFVCLHFIQNYLHWYLPWLFCFILRRPLFFAFCETKMNSCVINPICVVRINKNPLERGYLAEYLIRIRPRH